MRKLRWAVVLSVACAAGWAQGGDPPSRVARLSYQSGSVSFRPGSVEEWTAASLNYPLTTGDHLWTDSGAQTEMHVGSTAIRMAPMTALAILNLDDRTVQLSVTQGAVQVHVGTLDPDETCEVDTPNVAVTLLRPGDYRIDADGDNNRTIVTVRAGDAEVTGGGTAFTVHARQSARVMGMDTVTQDIGPAAYPDEFENWCETRDRRAAESQSARYVPPEMTGYEDLDQYGVWREEPQYGWVWAPRTVSVGWAPYRFGHWVWIEPWGWTWVDDAPWGFAPFHYGRWAYMGAGWVWVPGRRVVGVRPVYAPALVAFVGGPRFSVSVGVGGGGMAAWFPLGPHEVYRPAYRVSEVYVRNVNVTHVTNVNITNVTYVNQRVDGAVTAVSHETFVGARPVGRSAVIVRAREVERVDVIGATAPIAPRRESVMVSNVRVAAPPARFANRQVVARIAPPPPPVSFAARQEMLRTNQGRPLDASQMNSLRGNAPARNPMVRSVAPPQGRMQNAQPPAVLRPVETQSRPQPERPVFGRPQTDRPRVDRQPVDRPADRPQVDRPQNRPPVEQTPRVEQRTPQAPRQVEQRAPQAPRQVEQPRNERPQVREAPPARSERPANADRPNRGERRQANEERKAEKRSEKEERKER